MKKLVYSPDYRDKIIRLKNDLDLKYGQAVRKKVLSEINRKRFSKPRIQTIRTKE